MRPEMRPLLVFHHVPRTAGTSFRTALFNLFGEANCTHLREVDFLTGANISSAITRGPQPRMVCGHIPTRYVAEDSRDAAVTFLRDPIERVLSLYRFMRDQPLGVRAHVRLGETFTLREFLDCRHFDVTSQVDDGMCRGSLGHGVPGAVRDRARPQYTGDIHSWARQCGDAASARSSFADLRRVRHPRELIASPAGSQGGIGLSDSASLQGEVRMRTVLAIVTVLALAACGRSSAPQADAAAARPQQTFSGDATSDILFRRNDGMLSAWTVDGATRTASAHLGSVGHEWALRGAGDFNGDGRDDIVWRRDDGVIAIWSMNGLAVESRNNVAGQGPTWDVAAIGDFDGDGRDDLAWRGVTGQVSVWTMNGTQVTARGAAGSAPLEWTIVGAADFGGDGRDDLLWRREDGALSIWQLNGAAMTQATALAGAGAEWALAGVGDFNGDRKADLLWARGDGVAAVWTMNGAEVEARATVGGASQAWRVADVGDYDGDGRDDILWRSDANLLSIWTMDGAAARNKAFIGSIGPEWRVS